MLREPIHSVPLPPVLRSELHCKAYKEVANVEALAKLPAVAVEDVAVLDGASVSYVQRMVAHSDV